MQELSSTWDGVCCNRLDINQSVGCIVAQMATKYRIRDCFQVTCSNLYGTMVEPQVYYLEDFPRNNTSDCSDYSYSEFSSQISGFDGTVIITALS